MTYIRHLVQYFLFLLFVALGAGSALAISLVSSDFHYSPHQLHITGQTADIGFAARALPLAGQDVTVTGADVAEYGDDVFMRGQ